MSETRSYDDLVAWRSSQRCVDCGAAEGYTTVHNSRSIICRKCFADRANNPRNPNYGKLNP